MPCFTAAEFRIPDQTFQFQGANIRNPTSGQRRKRADSRLRVAVDPVLGPQPVIGEIYPHIYRFGPLAQACNPSISFSSGFKWIGSNSKQR